MPAPNAKLLTPTEASDVTFWRGLCPALSVETATPPPSVTIDRAELDRCVELLRVEGYINLPGILPAAELAPLRDALAALHARNIPVAFIFVYDEAWRVFQRLQPFLAHVLGADYRVRADFWAWFVPPSNDAAGWVPHRDYTGVSCNADGSPRRLTVWLPLTDTTPLNGCMYLLPAHLDPGMRPGDAPVVPSDHRFEIPGDALQNIRALPATAGSLLAWNQSVLHWGSRASDRGGNPRCSVAAQFIRADAVTAGSPVFAPETVPPFAERLGLIGHLICTFSGFLTFPPEIRMLGHVLDWKFRQNAGGAKQAAPPA